LDKKKLRLEQLTKNDEVRSSLLQNEDYRNRILRKIKGNLIDKKNPDGSLMYPGGDDDTKLLEDMQSFYLEFFRTGKFPDFQALADGGRAGYQVGGGVMGGGEDMGANRVTETATTPEPQKIDFDTLRIAVNSKWNVDLLEAREGIDGHCLPKDSQMYLDIAKRTLQTSIIDAAKNVDENYRTLIEDTRQLKESVLLDILMALEKSSIIH